MKKLAQEKLTELFMLRLNVRDKVQLESDAQRVGLAPAVFARLSLRAGSAIIRRKLPAARVARGGQDGAVT